jgi:quercetin dioxygenase-like cupin family protein
MTTPDTAQSTPGHSWLKADQGASITPVPGIHIRSMTGDKLMFIFVRIDPHAEVPHHQHVNEQVGTVIEGTLTITIGGESRAISVGDAYHIPANVPHSAKADEQGCLVIDVFSPPREDYRMP